MRLGGRGARPIRVFCLAALLWAASLGRSLASPTCTGDADGNGRRDLFDLVIVGRNYGLRPPADPRSDLNGDGVTNLFDLVLVGANYGQACPGGTPTRPTPTLTPTASRPTATHTALPTVTRTPVATTVPSPTAGTSFDPPPPAGGRITLQRQPLITLAGGRPDQTVIFVRPGTVVAWANRGTQAVDLISEAGDVTIHLAPGAVEARRIPSEGVFRYHDQANPRFDGLVVALDDDDVDDLLSGQTVAEAYQARCSGCHGPERQGAVGPALLAARLSASSASYVAVILDGRPGTAMGAWRRTGMTEAEAWAITGFLRSNP